MPVPQRPATLRNAPSAIFGAPASHFRKYKSSVYPGPGEYESTYSLQGASLGSSYSVPKAEPRSLVYRPAFPGPGYYTPTAVLSRRPQASIFSRRNLIKGYWWRPTPGPDAYEATMPLTLQRSPAVTIGNFKRVTTLQTLTAAPPRVGPGLYETTWGVGEGRLFGRRF